MLKQSVSDEKIDIYDIKDYQTIIFLSDLENILKESEKFKNVIMCGYPAKVGSVTTNGGFLFDVVM